MGWHESDSRVRMSTFKASGKWKDCSSVEMRKYWYAKDCDVHKAVAFAYFDYRERNELWDDYLVCLEPYHEHAHPILLDAERLAHYFEEWRKTREHI